MSHANRWFIMQSLYDQHECEKCDDNELFCPVEARALMVILLSSLYLEWVWMAVSVAQIFQRDGIRFRERHEERAAQSTTIH